MIYLVTDNYGTRKWVWTFKQALAWLPYCSQYARIRSVFGDDMHRYQQRMY